LLQLRGRLPAQAIVTAQLEHHHSGLCSASSAGSRAWPPALVSPLIEALTTLSSKPSRLSRCSSRTPTLAGIQAETGADTIANDQDCTRRCVLGHAHQGQASTQKPHTHRILHGRSILTAQNLSKVVPSAEGELTILHELSLELNKGDSLAIVGAPAPANPPCSACSPASTCPAAAKSPSPGKP
jgi:putative ABC transport system ATP-binding protein